MVKCYIENRRTHLNSHGYHDSSEAMTFLMCILDHTGLGWGQVTLPCVRSSVRPCHICEKNFAFGWSVFVLFMIGEFKMKFNWNQIFWSLNLFLCDPNWINAIWFDEMRWHQLWPKMWKSDKSACGKFN